MASRKRGTVQVRGKSISVVLDLGEQPWRRCPTPRCPGSVFTESRAPMTCERCGSALEPPVMRRRRSWHSGYRTQKEANAALTALLAQVDDGSFAVPTTITLREFVEEQWLPSLHTGNLRPSTVAMYQRAARTHILPILGSIRLRDVTPARLAAWLEGLKAARKGDRTVEIAGVTMHKILASAKDRELVPRNAADNRAVRAARPRPKAALPTIWTKPEANAFLAAQVGDRLYALWQVAVMTGLRRGEIAGMRWSKLDLDARSFTVAVTRVAVGWKVVDSIPKTKAGSRTIGLDAATVAALRSHRARQAAERLAAGELWQGTEDFVFTDELGRPLHPAGLTPLLQRRTRAAGLPQIRFHALRHGWATYAIQAGVPLPIVSKHLGHSSVQVTADLYVTVTGAMDRGASDQVADLIGRASVEL